MSDIWLNGDGVELVLRVVNGAELYRAPLEFAYFQAGLSDGDLIQFSFQPTRRGDDVEDVEEVEGQDDPDAEPAPRLLRQLAALRIVPRGQLADDAATIAAVGEAFRRGTGIMLGGGGVRGLLGDTDSGR